MSIQQRVIVSACDMVAGRGLLDWGQDGGVQRIQIVRLRSKFPSRIPSGRRRQYLQIVTTAARTYPLLPRDIDTSKLYHVHNNMSSQTTFGLWIINKAGGLIYERTYSGESLLSDKLQ